MLNSDADNILLIEDDSFASPNMFVKLSKILKVLKKNVEKNVAYVKLFSTEHFFGFENSDVLFFICAPYGFPTQFVWQDIFPPIQIRKQTEAPCTRNPHIV